MGTDSLEEMVHNCLSKLYSHFLIHFVLVGYTCFLLTTVHLTTTRRFDSDLAGRLQIVWCQRRQLIQASCGWIPGANCSFEQMVHLHLVERQLLAILHLKGGLQSQKKLQAECPIKWHSRTHTSQAADACLMKVSGQTKEAQANVKKH